MIIHFAYSENYPLVFVSTPEQEIFCSEELPQVQFSSGTRTLSNRMIISPK